MTTHAIKGEITGKKVLLGMVGAFSVIIAVNVALAVSAVRTFPGLEVKNSYVASQNFDRDRAAQEALGWSVGAEVTDGILRLTILGPDGTPVEAASIEGIFGRPTNVRDDQTPAFAWTGTHYEAPIVAGPGNWNLRLVATAPDGTEFRQRIVVLHE